MAEAAEGRTRRLITLIFAGRHNAAVMVVIRRELPRTRLAGLFEIALPQWHIDEDSPFRVPFGRFMNTGLTI
jgi:hypothetical protein